jgi:hypothetical protein
MSRTLYRSPFGHLDGAPKDGPTKLLTSLA